LTDRKFVNELVSAKKRNVEVVVLMDAVAAINFKDRMATLKAANIPVIVENWGGKNHEKTIMIDEEYLIIGSCNFTISGFYKNDENMLVIQNKNIAEFYADYFLYLFNSIDKKYLKYAPRAESFESKNSCYDGIDNNFDGKIDFDDDGCKNK
jgi:phosphatidylserine/phosphatidylglycerophosphate/cardiolipin synthase-like enzyme